jgi:hypothetical protein
MALWSAQFRHSGAVPILVLWIILIFVGMICSMAVLYGVNGSGTGPLLQYRFCTPGYDDTLPFSGNPTVPIDNNLDVLYKFLDPESKLYLPLP